VPRAVAINVGANTSLPGFRGPIHPDGSFVYVPIPEREPVDEPVPTYADLDLPIDVPEEHRDTPVHLDPEFGEYVRCERYTYGDEHGVKAAPLLDLDAGDIVCFYATLATVDHGAGDPELPIAGVLPTPEVAPADRADAPPDADPAADTDRPADWRPPSWGAYVVGGFRLARDPVPGEAYPDLPEREQAALANNAHVKRETVDAAVFLRGDPDRSGLLDRAVPLSRPAGGAEANALVTGYSADSGKGPWWRRPLRFDAAGTGALLDAVGEPLG